MKSRKINIVYYYITLPNQYTNLVIFKKQNHLDIIFIVVTENLCDNIN